MTTPLSTEARRFLRLARQAINSSRLEAIRIFDPTATSLKGATEALRATLKKNGPDAALRRRARRHREQQDYSGRGAENAPVCATAIGLHQEACRVKELMEWPNCR
jgi:hypothetical protein